MPPFRLESIKDVFMKSFEANHIAKKFEGVVALKDGGIKIDGAKICGLVGANGSGKTTFARICAGLIKRDEGNILIDGKEVEIHSPLDAKKYGIVLVHQNLSLIPDLSVWENINLGHEKRSKKIFFDNRFARENAEKILKDLSPDVISINEKVSNLTPSQMQVVEIVKALSQDPKLLILDEPTAALEYFQVEKLFKKIKELKEQNVYIVFISHRLWEVTELCDLVYVFRNGQTAGRLDFSKQARKESLIVPLFLGSDKEFTTKKKEKKDFQKAETVLELQGISFEDKIKDIDLKAKKGEVIGLGGLNGQGQEQLLMLIAGILRPTKGKILLGDKPIRFKHPNEAIKNGIFMVPGDRQRDGLFLSRSIFENIVYPKFAQKKESFFIRRTSLQKNTKDIVDKVSLSPPNIEQLVENLSGGNQQKVVFGRWLQFDSRILLLNDPAKGIDIQAKSDLYKLVKDLAQAGTTIILYASSNEELISNCDRVITMFEGRFVEEICNEEICDEKLIKSSLRVG